MRLVLASMILLVLSPLPVEALTDVLGWRSTRWGMTEAQVKAAVHGDGFQTFPQPSRTYHPTNATFMSRMAVGGARCEVFFAYDAGRLSHVTVACPATPDRYGAITEQLTRRYGRPTPRGTRKQEWKFPTTVIALDAVTSHRAVTIDYSPVAKQGDQKRGAQGAKPR